MINFKEEQIGEVLRRLNDAGVSVEIRTNPMGETFVSMDCVKDDTLKRSCTIQIKRLNTVISSFAYKIMAIYPDSEFAEWYLLEQRNIAGADGLSEKTIRRALFEVNGVMLYEEIIVKTDPHKPLVATSRYFWEDGTTFELSPTGASGGGILEFANKEQEK